MMLGKQLSIYPMQTNRFVKFDLLRQLFEFCTVLKLENILKHLAVAVNRDRDLITYLGVWYCGSTDAGDRDVI